MDFQIRELRDMTGLSQKQFADRYGIPVSTLRKWEQGESSPAPYIVRLLAKTIPETDSNLKKITGDQGASYYYDPYSQTISDQHGNTIKISEDLGGVKESNLKVYLQDLFESFYDIQERFNRDCRYDKEETIIWKR